MALQRQAMKAHTACTSSIASVGMGTDEPPCLLAPDGCGKANTFLCLPIDDKQVSRSPILKTLMEYRGRLEVLNGISRDDFFTWTTANVREAPNMSSQDVARVLQVRIHPDMLHQCSWGSCSTICLCRSVINSVMIRPPSGLRSWRSAFAMHCEAPQETLLRACSRYFCLSISMPKNRS